ncbi:MAG: hypothetical protein A3C35_07265 [Omnitrophica bacterium RIFCSPHIGHO2_02_FULL_46_11]|nr:MAG: hypothetical protein A3C35_07265 [Omnitrophica bacterium RIFCSPHIGHO2_02_FULL_46_11]
MFDASHSLKSARRQSLKIAIASFLSIFLLSILASPICLAADQFQPLPSSSGQAGLNEDYHVGANDLLEITVAGEEDLTQEVRVSNNGYVTYPLLGRIKVAEMSVTQLEDYLRKALAKDYVRDPQVRVFVKEFSNVFVLGQVKEPGPYPFKGGTVVQAITTAGGFTKIANQRKVRIVRSAGSERKVIHANVSSITKGDDEDVSLEPGDTVVVPESFF